MMVLLLLGCADGSEQIDISYGNIHSPVGARLVHGTLFVTHVVVNDSLDFDMLIDTGASKTYVPSQLFGNAGGQVNIASLCFENDVCISNFMALSADSGFTQSKAGYFNGIIGMDLLAHFDLTLDYQNELFYLNVPADHASSESSMIPIQWESGRIFATGVIEDIPQAQCLLDTGAAYTRLKPTILDRLSQNPEVLFKSIVFNYGASEVVEYVAIDQYCIGTVCSDQMIAQIGSWPAVGGSFFRSYLTTFKFSENHLILDRYPSMDHIKQSGIQRTGLQINIRDASQIVYVLEGSAAWEAGLRIGDQITDINGMPIASLGYFGIYELLADTAISQYQFLVTTATNTVENMTVSVED